VVDFIDAIFRETASRAAAGDVPLTYRQMRERWTDAIEKKNAFQLRTGGRNDGGRQDGSRQQTSRDGGSARGRGGGAPSKGGTAPQSRGAKYQGHNVCYHYNRPSGCKRAVKGTGCDNGNNGEYAHVCNFEKAPGVYCLQQHSRSAQGVTH
jgi:hypothetical protein